jgi:peptidyl-dipeptidase A
MSLQDRRAELHKRIQQFEGRLEAFSAAYTDAQWRQFLGRAAAQEIEMLEAERGRLLLDERLLGLTSDAAEADGDPDWQRRVALTHRTLLAARASAPREVWAQRQQIDRKMASFKPSVNGRRLSHAEQREVLRSDPDPARRRAAWSSPAPLAGAVETGLVALMRCRNRIARSLGWPDYPALALSLASLDVESVRCLFSELLRATEPAYQSWLSEAAAEVGQADVRPWDLAFVLHRPAGLPDSAFPGPDMLPAVLGLAGQLGLGAAARSVRVDQAEIPFGGLCFAVRPPGDVRILAGLEGGHAAYETLFHEFGHALHARLLDAPSPILRDEPGSFREAQACTLQRFAAEPGWLAARRGLASAAIAAHRRRWGAALMVRLRRLIGLASFECAAYAALAEQAAPDLGRLYRTCMQAALGIEWPRDAAWADNAYWTHYPMYAQNYVLAEAAASQTLAALRNEIGPDLARPETGAWLAEHYWRPAARREWTEKVATATGARLGTEALVKDLVAIGELRLESAD